MKVLIRGVLAREPLKRFLFNAEILWVCRYRLSFGCNDKLQLGALVTGFTHARCSMVAAAK